MDRRFGWSLLGCLCWVALCKGAVPASTVGPDQTSNRILAQRSIYSRRLEERAGNRIALRIEQQGLVLQDPGVTAYVNHVAQRDPGQHRH